MKYLRKFNESVSTTWTQDEIDEINLMFLSVKDECHLTKSDSRNGRGQYSITTFENKVLIIIKTCGTIPTEYNSYKHSKDIIIDTETYFDVKEHVEEFIKQLKLNGYIVKYKEITQNIDAYFSVKFGIRLEISK